MTEPSDARDRLHRFLASERNRLLFFAITHGVVVAVFIVAWVRHG